MDDPSLELQTALIAMLRNAAGVQAIVGARVYDSVPPVAVKPYVNLGKPQMLPERGDCLEGAETSFPIHGWSKGPKAVEIKRLGKAVIAVLHASVPVLIGHRVVLCELEQAQYLDDSDGITQHFVHTFRFLTEPTA